MSIKLLELFGGIGSCTQTMKRLGIDLEVVDYVEIDKYAVKSYNAINGTNYEPQDITKWDKDIEVDLLVGGFPCQDISVAGLGKGIVKGETRSGLMYEMMRIIEKTKPQYVIAENVKNLLSKKFRPQLEEYLCFLSEQGYKVTMDCLNASEFGVPQNRERVFIMGMKHENGNANRGNMHKVCKEILESLEEQGKIQIANYQFPEKQELTIRLKDILEDEVDEKYYISSDKVEKLIKQIVEKQGDKGIGALIKQATSTGSIYCKNGGVLNTSYPDSDTRRGRVISDGDVCGTIECANHIGRLEIEKVLIDDTNSNTVYSPKHNNRTCEILPILTPDRLEKRQNGRRCKEDGEPLFTLTGQDRHGAVLILSENDYILVSIRNLTPNECWRLMGFTDDVFELAEQVNSNSQLYKQAGNSIVVDVLVAILGQLRLGEVRIEEVVSDSKKVSTVSNV